MAGERETSERSGPSLHRLDAGDVVAWLRGEFLRPWWLAVLGIEAALLVAYFGLTDATVTRPGYVLAPFVWINASLWAVTRTVPTAAPSRRRLVAGTLSVGYFVVLLAVTGLVGGGTGTELAYVEVGVGSPGWGPVVRYGGTLASVTVVPYRFIGYLAIAYLVYEALLGASTAALSGVVGLASCVSCGFSVVLSVVAGLTGASSGAVGAVYAASVEVSTAAFLLALLLLVARPGGRSRSNGE
ncbi:DUF7546 family protein [Halobaculum limi]|uniref:DUF7546 family protein n=1 Tax=Halobaculum limi TaxID=3031916 RepID=UPI0024060009|nr:hypothetical protein [Halobaculum sp. YSMS11]